MSIARLQSDVEKQLGIFYEYDTSDSPLGEGGMGKVYRGKCYNVNNGLSRDVAIKFLYSDLPNHVIARARREASVRLRNDNLIEMISFIEIQSKDVIGQTVTRYHVVSEYLHGVTLDQLLTGKITDSNGKVIPFAQELYGKYLNDSYHFAIIIIRSLLSGLMALHDVGYIHRDIDPSNIMITADGHIKLIDFGIAKKINGNNTKESSYTIDGQFIGKPKYAAPELVRGLVDSQDICTDLYAVGILFYQLIVKSVPFDGDMAEVLEMQLNKKMPLHNLRQRGARKVVKRATQKKKQDRYQSAAEFRVAVDKLVTLIYPEKIISTKLISRYCGAAVAIIVGTVIIINNLYSEKDKDNNIINIVPSYSKAVTLMKNSNTAKEGFEMLKRMANENDNESIYLLSRLYFKSGEEKDINNVDSLQDIRSRLEIKIDNELAHSLLLKASELNKSDYRIQYELGCDYKSKYRGTSRKVDSAYIYFSKALQNAQNANDLEYQKKIADKMQNLSNPFKYKTNE